MDNVFESDWKLSCGLEPSCSISVRYDPDSFMVPEIGSRQVITLSYPLPRLPRRPPGGRVLRKKRLRKKHMQWRLKNGHSMLFVGHIQSVDYDMRERECSIGTPDSEARVTFKITDRVLFEMGAK